MSWTDIKDHDSVVAQFRRSAQRRRLGSTFLFVGPAGVGKRTFAMRLAAALLCERTSEQELEACGECDACRQVAAETHPDLQVVRKPADKSFIPIELFIGDREHRMRAGLCHHLALKPFRGGRRIAIIDDADSLNVEGANCLLKTLEEPPPNSVLILIATNEQRQLPTIRSRCQVIRFKPLQTTSIQELLLAQGCVDSEAQARRWAEHSDGGLETALEGADEEMVEYRQQLQRQLAQPQWPSVSVAAEMIRFVEAAGKEAPPRRNRLHRVIQITAEFYASRMRELADETAAACLERCLDAQVQLESNANLSTLIECWVDDLAQTLNHRR